LLLFFFIIKLLLFNKLIKVLLLLLLLLLVMEALWDARIEVEWLFDGQIPSMHDSSMSERQSAPELHLQMCHAVHLRKTLYILKIPIHYFERLDNY
jgi:hypothetical protein